MTAIDEGTKTGWTAVHAAFMGYCLTRTGTGSSSDPMSLKCGEKPNREHLAKRCRVELADLTSLEAPVTAGQTSEVSTGLLTSVVTMGLGWPSIEDWFIGARAWWTEEAR